MIKKINEGDFSIAKENKKDFKKTVISRDNLTNEFTIESLEQHQSELQKSKQTIAAQLRLTDAVIGNVGRNHAHISKMSDEALATASYLYENKQIKLQAESKLKEIKAALKKYEDTLKVIYTKFGFTESNVLDNAEPK